MPTPIYHITHIEDIKSGLKALIAEVQQLAISSIAIPPLGCGNGGLDWAEVKHLIESTFAELPEVKVVIFDPAGASEVDKMQVATPNPKFTHAHAFTNKTG